MTAPEPSADVQPEHDGECWNCGRLASGHEFQASRLCQLCLNGPLPVRPAAPSEPPDEDRSAGRWCAVCQQHGSHHTDRHESPAEGQQDDEPLVCAEHRAAARQVVEHWTGRGHRTSGPIALDELRAGIAAALASRPSADTVLRQVREVAVGSSVDSGGLYVDGWNAAMNEVRVALDGDR